MSEDLKFIVSVLLSSGIVSFIGWLLKKRISAGIENSIKNKYDAKIENLKSQLSISQSILSNSLANQSEGIKATHEKRLKSIDLFWEEILRIEEFIQPLNYFDPITLANEVERINKNESDLPQKFLETVKHAFKELESDKMLITTSNQKKELEKLRPYIGEDLWILRFYFNQFIGRIIHLYETDYHKGENLKHWQKDKFLKLSIENALSKDEIDFIYKTEHSGIERGTLVFKQKILNEIAKTTSGISIGKSSLENAILLSKEIADK